MPEPHVPIPLILIILMILPLVAGCATLTPHDAPGCKGARRPANPHGSVLILDAPAPASPTPVDGGACGARS